MTEAQAVRRLKALAAWIEKHPVNRHLAEDAEAIRVLLAERKRLKGRS